MSESKSSGVVDEGRKFVPKSNSIGSSTVTLEMTNNTEDLKFAKITFVLDDIARNIVNAAIETGYELIGTVILTHDDSNGNKRSQCVSKIYSKSSASSSCLIHQCGDIPEYIQSSWARLLISHPECKSCLILSGLPIAAYNSDMSLGGLRVLFTTSAQAEAREKFASCMPLEIGNILSGCTASVVCECEYNFLEAVVCVSLKGLSYSQEAAEMFGNISEQVKDYLAVESLSLSGKNSLHSKMIKSDQFLSRTENMYI
jgi:hypothetical protein